MITNLVASIIVTLITNVSERVPTHWESLPKPPGSNPWTLEAYGHEVADPDPKQKWVKTTITENRTLSFTFESKAQSILLSSKLKSFSEVEYKLTSLNVPSLNAVGVIGWVPVSTNTIDPTPQFLGFGSGVYLFTNNLYKD